MHLLRKLYRYFYQAIPIEEMAQDTLYEAEMELMAHTSAVEYHQAMVQMLQKRVKRLRKQVKEDTPVATISRMPAPTPLPTITGVADQPDARKLITGLADRAKRYSNVGWRP